LQAQLVQEMTVNESLSKVDNCDLKMLSKHIVVLGLLSSVPSQIHKALTE